MFIKLLEVPYFDVFPFGLTSTSLITISFKFLVGLFFLYVFSVYQFLLSTKELFPLYLFFCSLYQNFLFSVSLKIWVIFIESFHFRFTSIKICVFSIFLSNKVVLV